jgi:ABC-type Fe3+-siderophore transport system permease subunit
MIMIDQSRRLSEPLRWGRRERAAIAAVLACVVLAVVGLVAYQLTRPSSARADCINVTFASTLGAAQVHACGERARTICASPGSYADIASSLRAACRRAGFPFG